MMKTALGIVQSYRRRVNLDVPSALAVNTDPDELQLREVLYAVCEELRQEKVWPQQKKVYEFDTVDTVGSYQMPKDFYAPLARTQFNTDENNLLIGPVSDSDMSMITYGRCPNSRNFTYTIFGPDENPSSAGGQFYVTPTPSSVVSLTYKYISRNLFIPQNWVSGTAYTTASYVNANGNIYKCATNIASATTIPSGTGTGIVDGAGTWDYYDEPYEAILADTDLCLFDDDLVKLGLRAKLREDKGADFEAAEREFRSKITQAAARYKGSHFGSFGTNQIGPRYWVPYGNWSI